MDLQAGGRLHEGIDPIVTGVSLRTRYDQLWEEVTGPLVISRQDRYPLEARVRRLNKLGFDVAELQVSTQEDGEHITVTPKVVDAGHHSRRLMQLTGLDVEENQAQRLLNDLDSFRVKIGLGPRRRGDRRPPMGDGAIRARHVGGAGPDCAASSSPPRSSTRCSSTAGSCPSGRARACPSRTRSATTSLPSSPRSPTSRRSSARARARPSDDTAALRIVLPLEEDL